jgi:hypothetical protein
MNFWNQPYPESIDLLIEKAENSLSVLIQKINDPNCKALEELFKVNNLNGEVQRQKTAFQELGYSNNIRLGGKAKGLNEIKGLYLFGESENGFVIPRYVGISGSIYRRLKQHGWGKLHNEATLAYLKASSKSNYIGLRSGLDYEVLLEQQSLIRKYKVAILPEMHDYDLYFMEVYFAGKLKTIWNSFKTH